MVFRKNKPIKAQMLALLYVAIFFLSFHVFFVMNMNSNFLATIIPENLVGLIYIIGSAFGIFSLLSISRLLKRFGNYKTLFWFTVFEIFAFLGLAFLDNPFLVIPIFLGYIVVYPLLLYHFDIFIENSMNSESNTGSVRGAFLTIINMGLISAPLIAGFVLTNGDYWKIYLIGAFILVPFLFLIRRLRNFEDPEYHIIRPLETIKCIEGRKDLFYIVLSQLTLKFFYSWLVIYLPIYLHLHVGFMWSEIGTVIAIALLPYAFIEYLAGNVADNILGEKELLITGFLLMSIFISLVSFIEEPNIFIWAVTLFFMRIGAGLTDAMNETYFFKKVDGADNNTISFFRIMHPIAYMMGPLVGTCLLFFIDIQFIWIPLALICLLGVYFASRIHDTL